MKTKQIGFGIHCSKYYNQENMPFPTNTLSSTFYTLQKCFMKNGIGFKFKVHIKCRKHALSNYTMESHTM